MDSAALILCATILALPRTPPLAPAPPAAHGEATITTAEYHALLVAAEASGITPPASAGVAGARFRVTVDRDSADFEETFEVTASGAGWTALPVLRGPLDRASVSPSDRGFFFTARDVTRLAIQGPGSAAATLGARLRLAADSSGRRSLSLAMPLFAVQRGRFELPGTGLDVTVTGGELLEQTEGKTATQVDVAARSGALLIVAWREKNLVERGTLAPLKASATLYARSDVVGPSLVTDVTVRITATAGRIGRVEFEIPAGSKVLFLRGAGLLAAETEGSRLRAVRASPSSDPLEARLRLTRPLADSAPFDLPAPRLILDGPVDTYVELRPPPGVLAEMVAPGSFEPADIDKLPTELRILATEAEEVLHLPDAAPEFQPASYTLHRLEAAPVLTAQVRSVRGLTLVSVSGHALSRIEYEVVSSAKPFLTVHLTEGSRFWGAEAMGRPILPAMPEADSIAVPLRAGRRRVARVVIYVLSPAVVPKGKGTFAFTPPATDIPVSTLAWSFALPSGAQYRLVGTDYREGALAQTAATGDGAETAVLSELAQRAQVALARETQAAGRAPIVPRIPALTVAAAVRTELPGSPLKPIRLEVKPDRGGEDWQ
jgi:hypothetical protein